MLSRRLLPFALVLGLLVSSLARAGDKQGPPTTVVRVRSLDTVIDSAKLISKLVGREEASRQIEGLIRTKIGEKGLEGVDTTRPFGLYARIGKEIDDVSGALLIPVA